MSLINVDESPPLTEAERQPFEVHVEVHATERPAHSLETIRDDQLAAEPTSMDYLIADLRPEADTIQPEVETVRPEVDTVCPEVDTVHPTADIVTKQVEELQVINLSIMICNSSGGT